MTTETVRFNVDFSYPVIFTEDLFSPCNPALADILAGLSAGKPVRVLVAADAGLLAARPGLSDEIQAYLETVPAACSSSGPPVVLPGGEAAKNTMESFLAVAHACRERRLCRKSVVLAVGGGSVLDAAGLAASLVHRGMPLIRVPTTVLSQNDSGVGVKNGINLAKSKNFLGSFHPPAAVLNDSSLLDTLPRRDLVAGLAEAFKVAAIRDAGFLEDLCENAPRAPGDRALMAAIIRRCAKLHIDHIRTSGDPFESGEARPLDFGHWAAHKLETLCDFSLRHGEAVAVGIAIDLAYAAATGHITGTDAERVTDAMARCGLPVNHDALDHRSPNGRRLLFDGIEEFREHLGGRLHVTLPSPLGRSTEVGELDEAILEECLRKLPPTHS